MTPDERDRIAPWPWWAVTLLWLVGNAALWVLGIVGVWYALGK
jgi:hypothetical protein